MNYFSNIAFIKQEVSTVLAKIEGQISEKSNEYQKAYYPYELTNYFDQFRANDGERPDVFLRRLLNHSEFGAELYNKRINDYLVMIIIIKTIGKRIEYANIQAFVTKKIKIEDVKNSNEGDNLSANVCYYRLDYDKVCLGSIFKESLPHLHTLPEEEPRFSINALKDDIIVNFFELIYRNHFYNDWFKWAKGCVNNQQLKNTFEVIRSMYENNNGDKQVYSKLIDKYGCHIAQIKNDIITSKNNTAYTWEIDNINNDLLSYF